jgi:hypothetical protein
MVSILLIVCTFAPPIVPVLAQQPAGLTITSMDRGSVRPFDRLVISGTGFLPATAAISVSFVPKQHGVPIVIPAFRATATQVEVIVPAFLDPATGDFGFGQADVQVVQVTADRVMSSNALSALDVAPVPVLPESVGAGKMTKAFMQLSLEFLAGANGAAFAAFKNEQTALLAHIDAVVANPGVEVSLKTIDASPFFLTGPMLKASDRLIAAYLASIEPFVRPRRIGGDRAQALAEPCIVNTGSAFWDDSLCSLRVAVFGDGPNWRGGVKAMAAGAMVLGLSALMPPIAVGVGVAGVFVGSGLALAGAAQLVYLAVASTLGPSLAGPDAPPLMHALRHGRTIFENANAESGVPILMASSSVSEALTREALRFVAKDDESPLLGTIRSAFSFSPDGYSQNMIGEMGVADPLTAMHIWVLLNKANGSVFESRIVPPSLSWFDGAYLGTLNLNATGGGYRDEKFSLGLAFTVLNGIVTIIEPTGGSGTISANGRFTSSFLGNCVLNGAIEVRAPAGPGVGGGAVPLCPDGRGYTGWGTWSANRAPRP